MGQIASFLIVLAVILLFLIFFGLRVVQQYERGVIFILGRLTGAKEPGLCWIPLGTRYIAAPLSANA